MQPQKIRTFLWYDDQAEEAAALYVSLFPNSRIHNVVPGPSGKTFVVDFELAGVQFIALNGGPHFQFSEAISLSVDCENQAEIDLLWEKLTDGGEPGRCGWLKDRFGLSWQIVPTQLRSLLFDPANGGRVMQVMLKMSKLDLARLQAAAEGT